MENNFQERINKNEEQFQKYYRQYLDTGDEMKMWKCWPYIEKYCEHQLKKLSKNNYIIEYEDVLNDSIIDCIEKIKRSYRDGWVIDKMSSYFYWCCKQNLHSKKKQASDQIYSLSLYKDVGRDTDGELIIIKEAIHD